MKGYTDYWLGFLGPEAIATKPIDRAKPKYFNWNKAVEIIREHLDAEEISIGLREDWNNTSGVVYHDGVFDPDAYVYDNSCWATPIIDIDGSEIECYLLHPTEGNPKWLAQQFEIEKAFKDEEKGKKTEIVNERKLMVCAMEYIARQINDEDVFEGWLLNGVADGDIPYGEMSCLNESLDWYIEDEDFRDLMRCFLRRMSSAYKNGGLYCGKVCSGDRSDDE